MRDKLINALNGALKDQFAFIPLDATIKIADRLISEGFGLVDGRELKEPGVPCNVGDKAYVLFYDEDKGETKIDELTVSEVSGQRIWLGEGFGDNYYHIEEIGKEVFGSREAAEAYIKSPEYLAERVNMLLLLNVSNEEKKELLTKVFRAGQEYFERDTGRYIRLTDANPVYIWGFDVFDSNKELAYSTSALAVQLANDILEGYLVPAYVQEQAKAQEAVNDIIADASERAGGEPLRGREKEAVMD